jgi:hypothetical protein
MQPIVFGDEGQLATAAMLRRFGAEIRPAGLPHAPEAERWLRTLDSLDRHYGGSGALPLEDTAEVVAATLSALARMAQDAPPAVAPAVADITLGTAIWALRHDLAPDPVEPVVNALAQRSNQARTPQELAAVFGLMQGVIASVAPRLAPDLERSNPERPWRLLHANLAITAIRTEDPSMMERAFDALQQALPDEAATFFGEALALALAPGIAPEVRTALERRVVAVPGESAEQGDFLG